MRYAKIDELEYINGNGVGVSLYVQGCAFHCKGCFNSQTWDFNGGKQWTTEVEEEFLKLIDRPYVIRISFLGGEPLDSVNVRRLYLLIKKIKEQFPEKKIWLYTGFTYEKIISMDLISPILHCTTTQTNDYRNAIIKLCDVLVDGRYEEDKKDLTLRFRGSTNQRLIDVKTTLASNNISLIS